MVWAILTVKINANWEICGKVAIQGLYLSANQRAVNLSNQTLDCT